MGSTQSTRKLSVNNENVIQISEAALQRFEKRPVVLASQDQFSRDYKMVDAQTNTEEEYWKRRIEDLKKTHDTINHKMNAEYNDSVIKTAELFQSPSSKSLAGKLPPCQKLRTEVIKCYKENVSRPLACSETVKSFNDCVSSQRIELTPQ